MAGRLNEVEASVNTVVGNLLSVHAVLLLEVGVKSRFDVLNDRFPARTR